MLATAWLAGRALSPGAGPAASMLGAFVLAVWAFMAASTGAALLVLGGHVLDRVRISARWERRAPVVRRPAVDPADPTGTPL